MEIHNVTLASVCAVPRQIPEQKLPEVVFWNVQSRNRQQPVSKNEQGVVLVSGCSPRVFETVMSGDDITPEKYMMEVLNSERYAAIAA